MENLFPAPDRGLEHLDSTRNDKIERVTRVALKHHGFSLPHFFLRYISLDPLKLGGAAALKIQIPFKTSVSIMPFIAFIKNFNKLCLD